ncbi:MAG: GTPase HflX [Bacteroidales bacterium]|jgi:GTP-binding protein HflX|nr:GTPase HflX [Bacteroidales bacterium]MDD4234494.1 GTPase HflX [Bacteroidales bacterium]MDY0159813.1 GTPase HflX [Bacteroidales bacterium]
MIETKKRIESCVLVGLITEEQTKNEVKEYLEELAFLVKTAGVIPQKTFFQSLQKPHVKHFVGSGKLDEIKQYVEESEIDLVVFDDELSPTQLRNIEKILNRKILDRTHLILDIFALRAKTAYAKTQVELAQYQYLLPRLTRMWTHLERQRGGIGLRGPGETEIETDRRIIRDKISKLKKQLEKIDSQMSLQRKNRGALIRVALVGYTNAGKSTIMNMLSKSDVLAENKLFATLDTTVRKVVINNLPFLLSDTVGFIRKLPHQLVESFKSTLDETRESDLLIHVVDVSHPNYEKQIEVVQNTLLEIGAGNIPVLMVFNKIDAISDNDVINKEVFLEQLEDMWIARKNMPAVFTSAKYSINTDYFRDELFKIVKELHFERYPYNRV